MNKGLHNAAGFTLTEVLVASALSAVLMAMVMTLLVRNSGLWRDSMTRLQLSENSRVVRERVLHGMNGSLGLRQARRSQIVLSTNQVSFYDVASSNLLTLLLVPGQPPAYSDQDGTYLLIRSGAFVESAGMAITGNVLTIDLTLAITNRGKKFTQPQQIRGYLFNE